MALDPSPICLKHPLVKYWQLLIKDRSYREEKGRVVVSGKKLIKELHKAGVVLTFLVEKGKEIPFSTGDRPIIEVREEVLSKIFGFTVGEGIAAEVTLPAPQALEGSYFLLLNGLQDPGNLGTLLRSAWVLGWNGVIITKETVDPFNDKALRAAKGATFFLPIGRMSLEDIALFVKDKECYIASLQGKELSSFVKSQKPVVLVLGNEGKGVEPRIENLGKKITISMREGVDSLNVASAGAIFLYALKN